MATFLEILSANGIDPSQAWKINARLTDHSYRNYAHEIAMIGRSMKDTRDVVVRGPLDDDVSRRLVPTDGLREIIMRHPQRYAHITIQLLGEGNCEYDALVNDEADLFLRN